MHHSQTGSLIKAFKTFIYYTFYRATTGLKNTNNKKLKKTPPYATLRSQNFTFKARSETTSLYSDALQRGSTASLESNEINQAWTRCQRQIGQLLFPSRTFPFTCGRRQSKARRVGRRRECQAVPCRPKCQENRRSHVVINHDTPPSKQLRCGNNERNCVNPDRGATVSTLKFTCYAGVPFGGYVAVKNATDKARIDEETTVNRGNGAAGAAPCSCLRSAGSEYAEAYVSEHAVLHFGWINDHRKRFRSPRKRIIVFDEGVDFSAEVFLGMLI